MAYEVLMPQLGLTMEEGTVSQWIKHEGDAVKAGDVVVEITTDKLTNEITSEQDGVLLKIVAQEGEDVPVKGLLAYIGQPGEQVGETTAPAVSAASAAPSAERRWSGRNGCTAAPAATAMISPRRATPTCCRRTASTPPIPATIRPWRLPGGISYPKGITVHCSIRFVIGSTPFLTKGR